MKECFFPHPHRVPCTQECMAYVGDDEEGPKCLLLSLGAQFVGILRRVQNAEGQTKHPRSASPPEVR